MDPPGDLWVYGMVSMNPLRRQNPGCVDVLCEGVYCTYIHDTGKSARTPAQERERQSRGYVRCTHEWEISAVRS